MHNGRGPGGHVWREHVRGSICWDIQKNKYMKPDNTSQQFRQKIRKRRKPAMIALTLFMLVTAESQLSLSLLLDDQIFQNTYPSRKTNGVSRQSSSPGRRHKWKHRGRFRGPKMADVLGLH
jgi:hypothetical protein